MSLPKRRKPIATRVVEAWLKNGKLTRPEKQRLKKRQRGIKKGVQ